MATGDHDWTAGEQVTAANMDDYLQLQVVQQFATAAARDSALSARKREGMVTYQIDTNTLTVYSGAAWSTIGPVHGALTAWTPAVVQSGSVTVTVTRAVYQRIGRMITGDVELLVTGSGTANNAVTISTPVTAAYAGSATNVAGSSFIYDSSANLYYAGHLVMKTTSTFAMIDTAGGVAVYQGQSGSVFSVGLANPDRITFAFQFEAAADA